MRAVLVVLDGVGCGELPDAALYGDVGSNSLANTAAAVGGLNLPNMAAWGLGNIVEVQGVPSTTSPLALHGRMAERSAGKDTTSGHWELAGLIVDRPFPTYPCGFPRDLIRSFEEAIGHEVLGNCAASGTEIIERLGPLHLRTGSPIVYTSADSVFQIAAHIEVVPLELLYDWCRVARSLLSGTHAVARVIARPFEGVPGAFRRTPDRRDFSLPPTSDTLLDLLVGRGMRVQGVGKIDDIFAGRAVSQCVHPKSNTEAVRLILDALAAPFDGLLFANLVETDSLWGHRNDPHGYAAALAEFDAALPDIDGASREDLVIVTSDHGVDPTTESTDHSREYVPLLCRCPDGTHGDVGTRETFADVAATISAWLGLGSFGPGRPVFGV